MVHHVPEATTRQASFIWQAMYIKNEKINFTTFGLSFDVFYPLTNRKDHPSDWKGQIHGAESILV